jgi:hypothetical protein
MGMLMKTAIRIKGASLQRSFDRATRDPQRAQRDLLLGILGHNRRTAYGTEHDFASVSSPQEFASAVPINDYADLAPYVDRMKAGETNILTADQPFMFNLTSGTTDKPKFLPITHRGQNLTAGVSRQWLYRALQDHPALLDRAVMIITGSPAEGMTPSGIPYGSASGMIYKTLPGILHSSFVLPSALSEVRNYDLRYYLMARLALEHEVSFVATPNPTTLMAIARMAVRYQEEIVRSIRDGVLSQGWPFDIEGEDTSVLASVAARLRPNPLRAAILQEVIRAHGKLLPRACWRDLKLIGCWLGGSVGYQADKLAASYGECTPQRDLGYLSSEGSVTIPFEDASAGGILALQNAYYEFLEGDEDAVADARVLQSHQLERGRRYRILLTNTNGLYRYDMHDIIEVRDFYNAAPVIAFVRKSQDMLNITGEKLHVNHFMKAFATVKRECGADVTQFRAVPNYAAVGYELFLRVAMDTSREFMRDRVLPLIDRSLGEANIEYRSKRTSKRLNAPRVHVMDRTWEECVRRQALSSGCRDIQYKWRSVATEATELDARHIEYTIEMNGGSRG